MPKYKDKNGTTRVGDALRWLLKQGKEVAPELLKIAGNVTGIEALDVLASKIGADEKLSEADKQLLLEELNFDKIEMQETTKRWVSDNNTDSYLTQNIRPLTLAFLFSLPNAYRNNHRKLSIGKINNLLKTLFN